MFKKMGIYQIIAVLLILACLGILGYIFFKKNKTRTMQNNQITATKFQGKIKGIVTDCFITGVCSVILEPNIVIMVGENPGDVSPEIREKTMSEWGRLIGFELDEKYIGRIVEVYAKDAGVSESNNIHFYTLEGKSWLLEGHREYYIKLLP